MFQNMQGFSIGLNLVLVPASVSTLGVGAPSGIDAEITKYSDEKLFDRSVVNNAAYEYYERCSRDDLDIMSPPNDLRIWLFGGLKTSSAVMLHHGAVLDSDVLNRFLGVFISIVRYFSPDITIGTKELDDYSELYDYTVHELAHASHYAQAGNPFWNKNIGYVIRSFVSSGDDMYGTGEAKNAGYCEVSEMWAYYLEAKLHYERYGGEYPSRGTSYWFYPQIFRYLEERGLSTSNLFTALQFETVSRESLKEKLKSLYPGKSTVIEQIFNRYKYN